MTTNATDGSFTSVVFPTALNPIWNNVQTNGNTPQWTSVNTINQAAITGQFGQGRTIAMGIRVFPMIPATSPPGMVSLGLVPSAGNVSNLTVAMAQSTATLFNLPSQSIHMASGGCTGALEVLWRPEDVSDWELDRNQSMANPGIVSSGVFTAYNDIGPYFIIAGLGLPAGTSIWFELVMHLECTQANSTGSSATADLESQTVRGEGSVPSLEMLYTRIVQSLEPAAHAITDAIPFVTSAYKTAKTMHSAYSGPSIEAEYVKVH
jgi:hypothetical protein